MIKRLGLDKYSALYLWGFFIVLFSIWAPDTFPTWTSAKTVLIENVIVGVLAISFLIPLATGTYDLSIGTMMTMSLVIINSLAKNTEVPLVLAMVIALAACAVAGFISGFIVVRLKVNSFIATLGMSQIITAFVYFTSEQTISGELTKSYQNIGNKLVFGLPLFCYYLGIIAVIAWFILEHTPVGRHMFATGGNPEAARLVVYSWKVGTYGPNVGPGYLFPAIAAVFFGASQLKGRANIWGAMIALLALASGIKGLQLTQSGSSRWIEPAFTGLSLLGAVALASRNQVIKVPKRKQGAPASDSPSAAPSAPVEATV